MPQVSAMIRGLSPLARLEEMHPTLAKFSIPEGGEMTTDSLDAGRSGSGGRLGGDESDERRQSWEGLNGLSLSKAFETIEARKAELEVFVCVAGAIGACLLLLSVSYIHDFLFCFCFATAAVLRCFLFSTTQSVNIRTVLYIYI